MKFRIFSLISLSNLRWIFELRLLGAPFSRTPREQLASLLAVVQEVVLYSFGDFALLSRFSLFFFVAQVLIRVTSCIFGRVDVVVRGKVLVVESV